MKECSSYFFKYAKSQARFKAPIGPFLTESGEVRPERACDLLNQEYAEVFTKPKDEDKLPEDYAYTEEDLPKEKRERLENVQFTVEDIVRSINNTTSHSAGPSGTCPLLVRRTSGILGGYLLILYRKILDEKTVPGNNCW